jgi:hypothetical protein
VTNMYTYVFLSMYSQMISFIDACSDNTSSDNTSMYTHTSTLTCRLTRHKSDMNNFLNRFALRDEKPLTHEIRQTKTTKVDYPPFLFDLEDDPSLDSCIYYSDCMQFAYFDV